MAGPGETFQEGSRTQPPMTQKAMGEKKKSQPVPIKGPGKSLQ